VKYDANANGEAMCNDDQPMGVKVGKIESDELKIRYTYSVKWVVSIDILFIVYHSTIGFQV